MTTDYAVVGVKNKVKDRCPQTKVGLFFWLTQVEICPWRVGKVPTDVGGTIFSESRKNAHRHRWDFFFCLLQVELIREEYGCNGLPINKERMLVSFRFGDVNPHLGEARGGVVKDPLAGASQIGLWIGYDVIHYQDE